MPQNLEKAIKNQVSWQKTTNSWNSTQGAERRHKHMQDQIKENIIIDKSQSEARRSIELGRQSLESLDRQFESFNRSKKKNQSF